MTIKELLVSKITSGRYYLTLVAGIVFIYAVYAKILDNQAISAIITMVFTLYFTRTDRTENGGTK